MSYEGTAPGQGSCFCKLINACQARNLAKSGDRTFKRFRSCSLNVRLMSKGVELILLPCYFKLPVSRFCRIA